MKIYYITDVILDDRIVHATHINEVCKNFVVLGHAVILYAPTTNKFKTSVNYKIKFVPKSSFLSSISYQINLFIRLSLHIRKERPDILYCRQGQFLFVPATISKIFSIPIFFEVNGQLIDESKQINKNFIYKLILFFKVLNIIEFFNVRCASGFIVVSQGIKDYLLKTYKINPEKITVIANGVNTEIFKPIPSLDTRRKLNLDTKSIYVGYIGSLHSWQGRKYVAEAARLVCSKKNGVKFLIVGDGGDYDYIYRFIRDNKIERFLEIRPAVTHNLIPLYINAMDICLSYPLKIRGGSASPFKVYEYLACGKAVVVSDISGIREEFGDAVLYSEPESPDKLAHVIISIIDDEDKRQKIGQLGLKFIENGHSWQTVTKKISAFCEEIALRYSRHHRTSQGGLS